MIDPIGLEPLAVDTGGVAEVVLLQDSGTTDVIIEIITECRGRKGRLEL